MRTCEAGQVIQQKIGMTGFEPATPATRTRCATKLRYIPIHTYYTQNKRFVKVLSSPRKILNLPRRQSPSQKNVPPAPFSVLNLLCAQIVSSLSLWLRVLNIFAFRIPRCSIRPQIHSAECYIPPIMILSRILPNIKYCF